MRTPYFIMVVVAFVLSTSCRKTDTLRTTLPGQQDPQERIPKSAINAFVKQHLDKYGYFDWKMASDTMVWSALLHGDSILSVGYSASSSAGEILAMIDAKEDIISGKDQHN